MISPKINPISVPSEVHKCQTYLGDLDTPSIYLKKYEGYLCKGPNIIYHFEACNYGAIFRGKNSDFGKPYSRSRDQNPRWPPHE